MAESAPEKRPFAPWATSHGQTGGEIQTSWDISFFDIVLCIILSFFALHILRIMRVGMVQYLRNAARELRLKENAMDSVGTDSINIELLELNVVSLILIFFPSSDQPEGKIKSSKRRRQSAWGQMTLDEIDKPSNLLGLYGKIDIFLTLLFVVLNLMSSKMPTLYINIGFKACFNMVLFRFVLPIMRASDMITKRMSEFLEDPHGIFRHLGGLFRVFLSITLILASFNTWGLKVDTFLAGLGIGGLAIGLALQATLKDFFASFMLIADRPFKTGDYINVGTGYAWASGGARGFDGVVEYIGLRSTKIRMKDNGQLLHVPNHDLATARIVNQSQMTERRHDVSLVLDYKTPIERLRLIGAIFKDSANDIPDLRFSEFCFEAVLHSSGNNAGHKFVGVFYIESGDTLVWKRCVTELHFALLEHLKSSNIELAEPKVLLH